MGTPALGILLFLSDGLLPRVRFYIFWGLDCYRAWKFAILGRWTVPARRNPPFLSGGPLPRVRFYIFWGLDCYRAWKFAILGRWTVPTRKNPRFLSGGALPRVGFCNSWARDRSYACSVGDQEGRDAT